MLLTWKKKIMGYDFLCKDHFFPAIYHAPFLLCVQKDLPSLYVRRCITPKEMELDEKELF